MSHAINREQHVLELDNGTTFSFDAIGKSISIFISRKFSSSCIGLNVPDALRLGSHLISSVAGTAGELRLRTLDNLDVVITPGDKVTLAVLNENTPSMIIPIDYKGTLMLAEMTIRAVRHTIKYD